VRRLHAVILLLGLALALSACASGGSSGEASGEATAAAPKGTAPPAGHRMARLEKGMQPGQVSEIMGAPTSEQSYQTGKAWIPFYYGSDTHRTDWKYAGEGRVVFGHNRWSGSMKVIRIDYDPDEDGY
jgi:outer membrane protein assembly factor BamE (lipoprotein component of BamABCDE complex)